jgi:hypothetical protein
MQGVHVFDEKTTDASTHANYAAIDVLVDFLGPVNARVVVVESHSHWS